MPPMLSKTLLAVVLLAGATPVVYILLIVILLECDWPGYQWVWSTLLTNLGTGALLAVAWVLLWRREVHWTRRRTTATAVAGGLALLPATVMFLLVANTIDDDLGMILAGLTWAVIWLGGTTIIWRETPLERAERTKGGGEFKVRCPSCGYDLTGLSEARCPECGTRYTVDQLLGSQIREDPLAPES